MPRRAVPIISVLAALLLVAIVAGAATAGKDDKPKIKTAVNGTARASAYALVNRLRAVQATEAQISSRLAKSAAHSSAKLPKTYTQKMTLASAADGNYLFAATTEYELKLKKGYEYEVTKVRTRVIRTDRTSGSKTVLLDRKNMYVFAIVARSGSVAFQDASYKLVKDETKVDSKIYMGAAASDTHPAIESGKIELGQWIDHICGDFPLLAAISDKGEAVTGRVTATCKDDESSFVAELRLRRTDGSFKSLGPLSIDDSASSTVNLTGDRLLQTNPFERAAAIRTVSTNSLANLWHPGTQTADIGPDGTIAMIGSSTEDQFIYTFEGSDGEYYGEYLRHRGPAAAAKASPPPPIPEPKRERNPEFRMPFVIFPQGDVENPVLVAASRARIASLKFCGANLFALESKSKSEEYYDDYFLWGLDRLFSLNRAPFDVQLLDNRGALVRSLGVTKALTLAGVGCNGDRLLIIAAHGRGVRTVEMAP